MVGSFEKTLISLLHYTLSFAFMNILGEIGQKLYFFFFKVDLYLHSIWISFYLMGKVGFNFITLMNKKNECNAMFILFGANMECYWRCSFVILIPGGFFFFNNLFHLHSIWDIIIQCLQTSDNIIMHFCPLSFFARVTNIPFLRSNSWG
jgi:hypothetical protein